MFYCDVQCQKRDWRYHKHECKLLTNLNLDELKSDCYRFTLRLWLLLTGKQEIRDKQYVLFNAKMRCFNDLKTHVDEVKKDEKRMKFFDKMCMRFESWGIEFDKEDLFMIFCRICINSFSILNEDLNEIGTALYIQASVFDHSCVPNAAPVFNGINLQIRALKRINDDEEICINYIDLKMNRNIRHEKLMEQYYFECKCLKCETNSDAEIDYAKVKDFDQQFDKLISDGNDWYQAYHVGIDTVPLYKLIYGDFHPDLTVQLIRIVKVVLLIDDIIDRNEIISLITKSEKSLRITHGINHSLYKMFKNQIT